MSVVERDFWTARKMTPEERMQTVAGLDNGMQSRFEVGEPGRAWLKSDLAKVPRSTPLVVFSHSPLYKYYRDWNFWTEDADEVQAILRPFAHVTVIHGHTHQLLTNRIGNIDFHGMLSTAWPWPYAPTGLPALTVQMNRADPFDQLDGCGDGRVRRGRRRARRQDLQPVGPQSDDGARDVSGVERREGPAGGDAAAELLMDGGLMDTRPMRAIAIALACSCTLGRRRRAAAPPPAQGGARRHRRRTVRR